MIVRLASVRAASRLAARRCSTAAASSSQAVPPPTRKQLYRHAVCAAIPMIGFGACARSHQVAARAQFPATVAERLRRWT